MIIDTTEDCTKHLAALKAAGVAGIIRYLNPLGQTPKVITLGEAKAFVAAGMPLALVSEGWGDFQHRDISSAAGTRDGQHARSALRELGSNGNPCVYFAVDVDATQQQITTLVLPYFAAIRAIFGENRLGVYGSGAVCSAVLEADPAALPWLAQSTGWAKSKEFKLAGKAVLVQQAATKIAGLSCDPNVALQADWGQFVPFASSPVVVAPEVAEAAPLTPTGLYDAQLEAASGAINTALLNGIHKITAELPNWMQVIIPTGAVEHIAPALAQAALDAILNVKGTSDANAK